MSARKERLRPRSKKPLRHVHSGIGLSGFGTATGEEQPSFLTSRTARVLLAGAGFLADAYDLFVINLVLRLLRDEYPQYSQSGSAHMLEGSVASAALMGSIIGQLVAGSMADVVGRKRIFVITAALIALGSLGSACSMDTPFLTIYGQVSCWRFFLGAGVGGEYPLAATVTSESSSAGKRGSLMAAVFAMQGIGSLLSGVVVFLCLFCGASTAFTWRFALAFGAVPAILAFPWRLRMHETESFERLKKERMHDSLLISTSDNQYIEKNPITYQLENPPIITTTDNLFPLHDPDPNEQQRIGIITKDNLEMHNKHANNDTKANETTPLFLTGRPPSYSIDSNDYGFHYDINSRNNSNTDYLLQHLNRMDKINAENDSNTQANTVNNSSILKTSTLHKNKVAQMNQHGQPTYIALVSNPLHKDRSTELYKAFRYYRFHLLGTALSWFLLDVVFYANGLFNHEITSSILSHSDSSTGVVTSTTAKEDAINSIMLSSVAIPGYLLSVMFIEKVGRKNIQMMGFTVMAVLFCICGFAYDFLLGAESGSGGKYVFLLIYSLTFLFRYEIILAFLAISIFQKFIVCPFISNFGPNMTTFVIPGEIYPAEVRATCHGFSAASGKLGAATGAYLFPLILGPAGSSHPTREGMISAMYACAMVAVAGLIVTNLLIPSYSGLTLETIGDSGNNYIKLDYSWFWPTKEELDVLEEENRRYQSYESTANPFNTGSSTEMLQIVQASHDYAMNDLEAVTGSNKFKTATNTATAAPSNMMN
jgi:MFS family permease